MPRAFVAGATGAIGLPLCRLLVAEGWNVIGTTRKPERAEGLLDLGVSPVVLDIFDAEMLTGIVSAVRPDVVVHQLTDLPPGLDPALMDAARVRNTRIRTEGTRNLVAAAKAAGARRIVAQSLGFAYADGVRPLPESTPLDPGATGVISLEQQVLDSGLEAVVLRYGRLYGPGTGFDAPNGAAPVHVDAAADAALLAMTEGQGIYNIAEPDGELSLDRAFEDLGWDPDFRLE